MDVGGGFGAGEAASGEDEGTTGSVDTEASGAGVVVLPTTNYITALKHNINYVSCNVPNTCR